MSKDPYVTTTSQNIYVGETIDIDISSSYWFGAVYDASGDRKDFKINRNAPRHSYKLTDGHRYSYLFDQVGTFKMGIISTNGLGYDVVCKRRTIYTTINIINT